MVDIASVRRKMSFNVLHVLWRGDMRKQDKMTKDQQGLPFLHGGPIGQYLSSPPKPKSRPKPQNRYRQTEESLGIVEFFGSSLELYLSLNQNRLTDSLSFGLCSNYGFDLIEIEIDRCLEVRISFDLNSFRDVGNEFVKFMPCDILMGSFTVAVHMDTVCNFINEYFYEDLTLDGESILSCLCIGEIEKGLQASDVDYLSGFIVSFIENISPSWFEYFVLRLIRFSKNVNIN